MHLSLLPISIWMMKNHNLLSTLYPPSQCHLLSSPHARFDKPFSSSTPLHPKALMVSQLQYLKPVPANLHLFSTTSFSFPSLLVYFFLLGNLPTFSLSPKKGRSLILRTIAQLQSLHSSLWLWRLSSPNNCLPYLKQTTFFLNTSMPFNKPDLLVTFWLTLFILDPLL